MKKKKAAAVAVPSAKPEFVNTPGFQELEAEVQRRRAAGVLTEREPQFFSRQPQLIGRMILPALRDLMNRHGISEDDLERAAAESAQEYREAEETAKREAYERAWERICPPLFREPFDFGKLPEKTKLAAVQEVLQWQFGPRGLFIIGDSGMAKTTTMFAMLKEKVIRERRKVLVLDGIALATACSAAFKESSATEKWLREMLKPDILVIDDLAKRFTPATQEGFFTILDRRGANMKPLIITTNCSGDVLEEMIDDKHLSGPMRRRLRQYCEMVIF